MKRVWIFAGMFLAGASISSCSSISSLFNSDSEQPTAAQQAPLQNTARPVAMSVRPEGRPLPNDSGPKSMDLAAAGGMSGADRARLAHSLDSPPGKTTTWMNTSTGVNYSITPVRKVTVNDNHLCRVYQGTATAHNGQTQTISGTACIGDDGLWHKI